ncbi:MAG: hypothetical protein EOL89_04155 [Actinobacteria bacterium]|nr:hypothetical protein [Actinomycetota bacterium]
MTHSPRLAPVMVGSDLGIYSMARAFHERWGVHSHTVSNLPRGFINDSAILTPILLGEHGTQADQRAALDRLAVSARERGDEPVLVVNSDSGVDTVDTNRDWYEERFTVIVPPGRAVRAVEDKARLAGLATASGLHTPRERVIDFATLDGWRAAAEEIEPPYILKPATSGDYENLHFPGKLKVYVLGDASALESTLEQIAEAGYGGRMLLQELIPGDDTHGYVATVYIDRTGTATLQATARMLLAIHTPNLLGNMALGLVRWYPDIAERVTAVLRDIGYRGFATVDVKVDARTGKPYLLDINPRPGRSNHFISMGGINPMEVAVADVRGEELPPRHTGEGGVYRIVPLALLRRYVTDPVLRGEVVSARRAYGVTHPLAYPADSNPRRTFYRYAASINHVRAFARVYPRPTETSF